jgi:hypothetical protein
MPRQSSASRGGSSQRQIFFEKLLDSGELLQTHISHSRRGGLSPGRWFGLILREQIKVSRAQFWQALSTGEPVARPGPVKAEQQVEHEAWILAVLTGELHMTAEQIEELDPEQARQLVLDHWSQSQEAPRRRIVDSERQGLWAYYYVIPDALKELSAWLS